MSRFRTSILYDGGDNETLIVDLDSEGGLHFERSYRGFLHNIVVMPKNSCRRNICPIQALYNSEEQDRKYNPRKSKKHKR